MHHLVGDGELSSVQVGNNENAPYYIGDRF